MQANLTPDMLRATPIRQDQGRPLPHVPLSVTRRDMSMMAQRPPLVPGQRQRGPEHQPWCDPVEHILDISGFGTCVSADMVTPGMKVRLLWSFGEGVRADVSTGDHQEEIVLTELEQRALAMLTTALIGRGRTPAPSVLAAVTS